MPAGYKKKLLRWQAEVLIPKLGWAHVQPYLQRSLAQNYPADYPRF